jgi:twitching motility protein PilT
MANIDAFLWLMLEQRASDLQFVAGHEPVLRIDGELVPVNYRTITSAECLNFIDEILPPHKQDEFRKMMDIDFSYQLEDRARFRVNLFQHRLGSGATFRMIPMQIPSMEELHLPLQVLNFTIHGEGLILVTGPCGHGKSTTLASLIDYINTNRGQHIMTIEDPIEFAFKPKKSLVTQREIGRYVDSYEAGLRTILRNMADVILIGELQDTTVIDLALTAAQTGSLVFSTLPAQTCSGAVSRIIDSFPYAEQSRIRNNLAISLKGIINQKLVRRSNDRGRVPVVELLNESPELSAIIRRGFPEQIHTCFDSADTTMNISFDQSLMDLYTNEYISLDTAISHARKPETFESLTI